MQVLICFAVFCLGFLPLVRSSGETLGTEVAPRADQSSADKLLNVFEVHRPISDRVEGSTGCNREVLLMEHVFAYSYGNPFIGELRSHQESPGLQVLNRTVQPARLRF